MPQLNFQRFECKYLVTEGQARAIRRMIAPWVRLDSHAAGQPDGCYPIVSLYLDSPDLRLHRETIEGQCSRFKLRIRGYADGEDQPLFLEIKRRRNQVVTKSRVLVSRRDVRALLAGGLPVEGRAESDRRRILEFANLLTRTGAEPTVTVRYLREAYEGVFDPRARVTFDRQIACRPGATAEVSLGGDGWRPVEGRKVVLELKFDGRLPAFLQQVIRALELQRISYSKYSNSILRSGRELQRFGSPVASH